MIRPTAAPVAFLLPIALFERSLGVQRLIPFGTHHPGERGQPAAEEAPFEVIPAEVLLAVLPFDSSRRSSCAFEDRFLFFRQRIRAGLDAIKPVLVSVPPDFVPESW